VEEARRQQSEGKLKAAAPVEGETVAAQHEEEEASPKTEPSVLSKTPRAKRTRRAS